MRSKKAISAIEPAFTAGLVEMFFLDKSFFFFLDEIIGDFGGNIVLMFNRWKYRWKSLWNPALYHGFQKKSSFFEGWYYKIVNNDASEALAFIPGISMDGKGQTHAFIQVLNGIQSNSEYFEFESKEFHASKEDFQVQIGKSIFSNTEIIIELPGYHGHIQIKNPTPWPKYFSAPGIMGWYSFVPFMECYHGVLSMDHTLDGFLQIGNKRVSFDQGRGYIEKDWGVSFPRTWIWMQSNHFKEDFPISVTASAAHIPWMGSYFVGFIAGIWYKDKLYRFATYTAAKMKAAVTGEEVFISFKSKDYLLEIVAIKAEGGQLVSPIKGDMKGKLNESLQAHMKIAFYEKNTLIYKGESSIGGLEIAGDYSILLTDKWRN